MFYKKFKENNVHNFGQRNIRLIVLQLNRKNKELGIQIAKVEVFPEQEGRKKKKTKPKNKNKNKLRDISKSPTVKCFKN